MNEQCTVHVICKAHLKQIRATYYGDAATGNFAYALCTTQAACFLLTNRYGTLKTTWQLIDV